MALAVTLLEQRGAPNKHALVKADVYWRRKCAATRHMGCSASRGSSHGVSEALLVLGQMDDPAGGRNPCSKWMESAALGRWSQWLPGIVSARDFGMRHRHRCDTRQQSSWNALLLRRVGSLKGRDRNCNVVQRGARPPLWRDAGANGANPIPIAVPTKDRPFVLDLAASVVSMGKIHHFAASDKALEEGWERDAQGHLTTNAEAVKTDFITPFGGAKGYGLGLGMELMLAALVDSPLAPDIRRTLDAELPCNKGTCRSLSMRAATEASAIVSRNILIKFAHPNPRILRRPPGRPGTEQPVELQQPCTTVFLSIPRSGASCTASCVLTFPPTLEVFHDFIRRRKAATRNPLWSWAASCNRCRC